ncbi:hypothetical protein PybrP1_004593 [[Pythium] brassicae (nom. inval.)]|nr:hypothetical protein PybrP1_004593 [[Pythium] brassicae (nom. inval.)]
MLASAAPLAADRDAAAATALLRQVFRFRHKPPSIVQEEAECVQLARRFAAFADAAEVAHDERVAFSATDPLADDRRVPLHVFAPEELHALQRACAVLNVDRSAHGPRARGAVWIETWLSKYGCALQLEAVSVASVALKLVVLDGWEHVKHFLADGTCVHSAVPRAVSVLNCGSVRPDQQPKLLRELRLEIDRAQPRTGAQRSAGFNDIGHQKTPQFIAALVRIARARVAGASRTDSRPVIHGGTTDVGLHTGGQGRDTCWPLVQAVVQQNLPGSGALFDKAMMRFKLSLAQAKAELVSRHASDDSVSSASGMSAFWDAAEDAFSMLQTVVLDVVALVRRGYDATGVERVCDAVRQRIVDATASVNAAVAARYTLPTSAAFNALKRAASLPRIARLRYSDVYSSVQEGYDSRQHASQNVGLHAFVNPDTCDASTLIKWLDVMRSVVGNAQTPLVVLRTIESFVFTQSSWLHAVAAESTLTPDATSLRAILHEYDKRLAEWTKDPLASSLLEVEQRSRSLLVKWTAFCVAHKALVSECALLKNYGIALSWEVLEVAVLRDKAAIDTLSRVTKYIRSWNQRGYKPVFDLNDPAPTVHFVRAFASESEIYTQRYTEELKRFGQRVTFHWKSIVKKKQAAVALQAEIAQIDVTLRHYDQVLREEQARLAAANRHLPHHLQRWDSPAVSEYATHINNLSTWRFTKERVLEDTRSMPGFLVNPLPRERMHALEVLFFLDIPKDVAGLWQLCLEAQRALAPPTLSTEALESMRDDGAKTTWLEHYRAYSSKSYASTAPLVGYVTGLTIPQSYGPWSIDEVQGQEECAGRCIWYPSGDSDTRVYWTDPSGAIVNPFRIPRTLMVRYFTHEFAAAYRDLQWAVAYPGGEQRGNVVYAKLSEPLLETFDRHAFIHFGMLRAFPNQQIRRVCHALKDNVLPWSHPCVVAVVRQAMYQVGTLTDEEFPSFAWKADIADPNGAAMLSASIDQVATQLDLTPRNFEDVPLLSELAAFASQTADDSRQTVAKFATMCRRWAGDVRKQYHSNRSISSAELVELRAKECLLYGYALQSYAFGSLRRDDLVAVGELVVLFRNSLLFAKGSNLLPKLQRLELVVSEILAKRVGELVEVFKSGARLTRLVRLVSESAPAHIQWTNATIGAQWTSSFNGVDKATGTFYAVNLFNGLVLIDGSACGGLPSEIRASERYRALFGDHDFEVAFSRGVYRTTHPIDGRYFDFSLLGNELRVRQVYYDATRTCVEKVLDLCPADWLAALDTALPACVVEMHSLWVWVEEKCVLVCPLDTLRQAVEYVATFAADRDGVDSVRCVQVPAFDKRLPTHEILKRASEYPAFVTVDADLLRILGKFEAAAFTHVLREPSGVLTISFPRCRLTFVLNERHELASAEYDGYVLDECQQYEDAFPLFARYLVLRLKDAATSSTTKPTTRILVPFGRVVRDASSGMIDVQVPNEPSAKLVLSVFESHLRLRTLSTESIPSRLQLCALLAAAGSNIPSKCFAMTGSEAALQVLHGCFFSAPLAAADKDALTNVCAFGHREPGLKILASSILLQSERCSFLAAADRVDADGVGGSIDCAYELDEYSARCAQCPERNPLRSRLRKAEERLLLSHIPESDTLAKVSVDALVELAPAPVKATYVSETEALFARFLRAADVAAAPPPLPLSQLTSDAMGEAMSAELLDSWNAYHAHYDKQLATSPKALALMCALVLKDVRHKREQTERYLLAAVDATRSSASSRLLHLINYLPTPTVTDLVRSSFDDEVLLHLAARLSLDARAVFRAATLQFMELCVLEDKLERLVRAGEQARSSSSSDAGLLDELGSVRQWVSAEHPYWLAFEVEGRLQIRHEQYVVAAHLIATPGAVSQMNMGRGKTKVILPMLFLYFSHRHRGDRIVRAHFLTPLLSETRQFMHRTLSASSILQLHFVEHPFHRNIELDAARLSLLQEDLADARASGRFLLIAPEHRMSLELKLLDLRSSAHDEEHQRDMVRVLEAILDHRQYVDVLDESDAVLHHKYHLIYAVGAPQKLESGECRWLAAEALLHALAGAERNPESELRRLLLEPHVGFRCPEYADRLGGYDGLRLNASVSDKPRVRQRLREALVCEVFADPPLSLKWLRAFSLQSAPTSRQLVRALTDPSVSLDAALDGCDPGVMRFRSELLALRGLLAFGVLEHCLEKRHRVEFGLPEAATRRKRMAIPFRAADIPSERSEFSHPEVGLTLTLLAYYNTGLSEAELRETLHQLLQLGASEQDQFYALWLAAVQRGLPADIVDEFPRSPRQLSPNDTRQFAVLYRVFRYTMAVVNFFANTCVFPSDTTQYPLRLTRSAWNVAGGDWNVGFSGTNDNHRLLPLSVRQCEPAAPALLGTNGRMIDRILRVCQGFAQVEADAGGGAGTPWQRLLQLALAKRAHALIDTGALLAGVLNNDAALYLLDEPGFPFAGVTYYDTRKRYDCWVVLDAASRLVTPLKDSTVLEEDTFVVFDDARSRGSDLKLDAKAVAVLTLGPKLTKDKLMQGAGRMRQLGCDQTLWFVSLSEVAQDVLQLCGKDRAAGVRAVDILDWVMANTKTEAVLGLLEWANSGLHFSQCQQCPDAELRTEDWSVEALYAPGHRARLIRDIVDSRARALLGDDTLGRDDLVRTICARGATFGLDAEVLVTSHDDECERELHNEQFEEREDAAERVGVVAVGESPWDFQQVLNVGSVRELAGSVEVVALGAFVRRRVRSASLSAIGWDAANVFGTANFFSTVATPSTGNAVSDFPRLADALLAFADGSNLLVSEFEADAMLPLLRTRAGAAARCTLVSLSSAVDAIDAVHGPATLARDVPWSVGGGAASRQLDASLTTLCQLFNGDTMFSKRTNGAVDAALRAHLRPLRKRERAFQEFAVVRGCELRWRYSFLHTLCHEMDLEDFVAPETVVQSPPSQQPRTTTPATATTTTATTTPKGRKAARAAKQAARKPKQ